jgi:hypothetical protein
MPTSKERVRLKTGKTPQRLMERLKRTVISLYGVNPEKYIPVDTRLTCINGLCIIHSEETYTSKLRVTGVRVLYEGSWLGVYTKKHVLPSTTLAARIIREYGLSSAIIVNEKAVKAFLYGNDILPESVIEIYPSSTGVYAVLDQLDHEVIGFSRWSSRRNIYVNLYDIGFFLRNLG